MTLTLANSDMKYMFTVRGEFGVGKLKKKSVVVIKRDYNYSLLDHNFYLILFNEFLKESNTTRQPTTTTKSQNIFRKMFN